jgi:hypothetical protein
MVVFVFAGITTFTFLGFVGATTQIKTRGKLRTNLDGGVHLHSGYNYVTFL